jgi:hypothetical protein
MNENKSNESNDGRNESIKESIVLCLLLMHSNKGSDDSDVCTLSLEWAGTWQTGID